MSNYRAFCTLLAWRAILCVAATVAVIEVPIEKVMFRLIMIGLMLFIGELIYAWFAHAQLVREKQMRVQALNEKRAHEARLRYEAAMARHAESSANRLFGLEEEPVVEVEKPAGVGSMTEVEIMHGLLGGDPGAEPPRKRVFQY